MLAYGDARRIEDPREKALAIRAGLERWRLPDLPIERHALAAELLIEAGELEQGLLDARAAPFGEESPGPLEVAASRLTRAIADLLLASFRDLEGVSEAVPRQADVGAKRRRRSGDAPRGVSTVGGNDSPVEAPAPWRDAWHPVSKRETPPGTPNFAPQCRDAPWGVSGSAAPFRSHARLPRQHLPGGTLAGDPGGDLPAGDEGAAVEGAADDLLSHEFPATVEVSIPEGYAFYGLYPESYLAAAGSALRPDARVIGIRSIGTSLSALVAAVAGERSTVFSVRPVGHPFDRRLAMSAPQKTAILAGRTDVAMDFGIVDEGPGLSGSSFGCVADWLEDHGVAPEAIAFFPSHRGDPGPYASPRHRERWRRARRHVAEFEDLFLSPSSRWPLASWVADLTGEAEGPLEDLSAGRWRERLIPDRSLWPAADVQGERRKLLLTAESGSWLLKFAGLGRYGREKLAMARELDGLIPPVAGLRHGFLVGPWLEDARPLPLVPEVDRGALLDAVASYLARRTRLPADPRQRGAAPDRLFEMLSYNAGKALGADAAEALEAWHGRIPEFARRERPVLTDNKPHAWEWLVLPDGRILKADALDHTQGNDLVGPQDIAWDVAGTAVELDLDGDERGRLADHLGVDPLQLDVYTLAYLGFQLGRHTLAAEALAAGAPEEAARMRVAVETYTACLRKKIQG
ncbi:MAG TPA: hypothetical protein VIE43_11390 [Thermoanaerobaculia bacterium]|nr:hypothetical protein [Thermoanaerobaculia bacterium]